MEWDFRWDDEVDVVCTDSGSAGIATAISAVRSGGTVFVAESAAGSRSGGWFGSSDADTAKYLHELSADIDVARLPAAGTDLPVRLVRTPPPVKGRRVPTFDGSRLRDWAAQCIPSPSGYVYTRVTGWDATTLESAAGNALAVSEIGALSPDPHDIAGSVRRWLDAQARDYGVVPEPARFQRLVLAEGVVAGAVFDTDEGPVRIRARHGVLISGDGGAGARDPGVDIAAGAVLRPALVGMVASRFGRVELLTDDPDVAPN